MSASLDFQRRMLEGFGLTTVKVTYGLPDYPSLVNTLSWQFDDVFPHFPRLVRFLDFWRREIEGPLHKVEYCHRRLITPAEIRLVKDEFRIH